MKGVAAKKAISRTCEERCLKKGLNKRDFSSVYPTAWAKNINSAARWHGR